MIGKKESIIYFIYFYFDCTFVIMNIIKFFNIYEIKMTE